VKSDKVNKSTGVWTKAQEQGGKYYKYAKWCPNSNCIRSCNWFSIRNLVFNHASSTGLVSNQTLRYNDVVVFSGIINGTTHQIFSIHSGTDLTNLTNEDHLWHFEPVSSPGGSKIAYVTHSSFFNMPPDGRRVTVSLHVMDSDGTNKVLLANSSEIFVGRYVWSSDSTKIAYEANEDIFVVNADGTNTINLTNDRDATHDFQHGRPMIGSFLKV
jgi:hypothetical protein